MSPPKKSAAAAAAALEKFRRPDRAHVEEDGAIATSIAAYTAAETAKVLEAISVCQTTLTSKIEEIKVDISLIRQDATKLRERVTEAEARIGRAEDALPPLQHSSDNMQRQLQQLARKQDDMENRARRSNLRFVGLPEGVEGSDPAMFLEDLLIATYGREAFSTSFVIERAHRMPARRPPEGAPPRTLIARFLNFRDRDSILRLSRDRGKIPYRNVHVLVFPDYSAELQKLRSRFTDIKKRLRLQHIKYAVLFPARLRVVGDDRVHFFENPEQAVLWLDHKEAARKHPS